MDMVGSITSLWVVRRPDGKSEIISGLLEMGTARFGRNIYACGGGGDEPLERVELVAKASEAGTKSASRLGGNLKLDSERTGARVVDHS